MGSRGAARLRISVPSRRGGRQNGNRLPVGFGEAGPVSSILKRIPRPLREMFRPPIRRCLHRYVEGGGKDIVILSSPRSRSTWLMELLYAEPGVEFVDEPLNKDELDRFGLLPIRTRWNYLALDASEEQEIKEYFCARRRMEQFPPLNILDPRFSFRTRRRAIKVIRASSPPRATDRTSRGTPHNHRIFFFIDTKQLFIF